MMTVNVGDIIETKVGGPYKVISVKDNLITFQMKLGIGMTLLEYVTNVISKAVDTCEYSGLPAVKSYDK